LPDHDRQIICSLVPVSISYLGYDKENPVTGGENGDVIDDLKYSSNLRLFIHCTLYLSGNPIRRFRKSWRSSEISKIRAIRSLGGAVYRGARLYLELRGHGIERKIAEIMAQQKELSLKNLPPRLDSYVPH